MAATDSASSPAPRMQSAAVTPACCARPTTPSRSFENAASARWQWLSIIAALSDARARGDVLVETHQRRLAPVGTGREHHAVRFDPHQLGGLEIEDHDDRPADELLGFVG